MVKILLDCPFCGGEADPLRGLLPQLRSEGGERMSGYKGMPECFGRDWSPDRCAGCVFAWECVRELGRREGRAEREEGS